MVLPTDKGRELERKIAEFFALNGYQTQRNVVLEGRSGGRHELDVLTEKSDGITTFRAVVECKAWDQPIEKDVVAKLDYVIHDLGLNKGIIVALAGWRAGAEQSAVQLGIELWGPDEVESRLGQVALAALKAGPTGIRATGLPFQLSADRVHLEIVKQSRNRLGLGREEIVGVESLWVPYHVLEIACSRPEKQFFRKTSLKARTVWNAYEGLEGSFVASFDGPIEAIEIVMGAALRPRATAKAIVSKLQQTVTKAREVVRPDAQRRYAEKLAALGIPLPTSSISVDSRAEIYLPFHVGRLRARGGERLVAVDGINGHKHEVLGGVLTRNMSYVIEAVRQARGSSPGPGAAGSSTQAPARPDV